MQCEAAPGPARRRRRKRSCRGSSSTKQDRRVDPIEDLRPLCPNCHRMIHRKSSGVYTIEELKTIVNS
ncbi:MAG: HNH endonuclease [Gordonibacter pamelaeae]|nr:HNH endonuclease [Gordonibacter pamelaeae]